jgi:hypothetical protein
MPSRPFGFGIHRDRLPVASFFPVMAGVRPVIRASSRPCWRTIKPIKTGCLAIIWVGHSSTVIVAQPPAIAGAASASMTKTTAHTHKKFRFMD